MRPRRWLVIAAVPVATLAAFIVSLSLLATGAFAEPCGITWTGSGDGTSWDDPNNWGSASVPTSSQHVCIQPLAATTVISDTTTSVLSITTNDKVVLEVTSGLLSVTSASDISVLGGDLLLSGGGAVTVSAGVDVADAIELSDFNTVLNVDAPSTAGSLRLAPPGNPVLGRTGSASAGALTVSGTFDWQGGTLDFLPVTIQGTSSWTTANAKGMANGAVLTLDGDTSWTGGALRMLSDPSLINHASLSMADDAFVDYVGGTRGTVTNAADGTITVNGSGTTTLEPIFDNRGTIAWGSTATLQLLGGGTTTTTVDVPAVNTVELSGSHNWTGGTSDLTGTGTLIVSGGSANTFSDAFTFSGDVILDNAVNSGNLFVTPAAPNLHSLSLVGSGDAAFTAGVDVAGEISITGGAVVLSLDGPSTAASLVLNGSSSVIQRGTASSTGSLDVAGTLTWGTGTFGNGLQATINGATTISGFAGVHSLNVAAPPHPTVLILNAATTWTAGVLQTLGGSEIVNNATFTITHDALMDAGGNPGTFTNNGSVAVNGSGTTTLEPIFDNRGTLFIYADAILNASAYFQSGTGALRMEVIGNGGPGVGHGQLIGSVNLDGALEVDTSALFTPTSKFDYRLVDASGVAADAFVTLNDLRSGNSVSTPPNIVDGDTHTWEVRYNQNSGSNVVLHTMNIFPVALDDVATSSEDQAVNINVVTGSDTDADGDLVLDSITIVTAPELGTAARGATPATIDYTPDPDQNGSDTFEYQICDSFGKCDPASVTITVTAVNDAPVAADDAATLAEDDPATTIDVLANDSPGQANEAAQTLIIDSVVQPTNGTLVITNAGADLTYEPAADFHGTDAFSYTVCDNGTTNGVADPLCDGPVTVTVTVTEVSDAPVAADDTYATNEDTPLVVDAASGVLGNDSDADGDPLSAVVASGPASGTLTLNADGSFTYTPDSDFHGTDSFTYDVSDGNGGSDTAAVSITVDLVNDAPLADAGADHSGTVGELVSLDGSGSSDVDGDALTYAWTLISAPAGSSASLADATTASPSFMPDVAGDYVITLTVDDGNGGSDTDSVTVTADPVPNSAPVAADDAYATDEDTILNVAAPGVLANDSDADGDPLSAAVATGPSSGTLTLNADGSFTYTPNADFNGSDSFSYTSSDGNGSSDTAAVSITVNAPTDVDGPITSLLELAPNPVAVNTDVSITALVDDTTTGGSTISSAEYRIGNDGPFTPLVADDDGLDEIAEDVSGAIPASSFPMPDIYDICVRGSDAAGNIGPVQCVPLAVYDPTAGFVTGAGWFDSPAGAYKIDPALSGQARFAFVSKYAKGRSVPDGQTKFTFTAADLKFESTAYEYLIVNKNDSRGQFKGTGTINGGGTYGFMVWAIDDDEQSDTFRIEIWDVQTDTTVYDNGTDQPISAGQITIHAK